MLFPRRYPLLTIQRESKNRAISAGFGSRIVIRHIAALFLSYLSEDLNFVIQLLKNSMITLRSAQKFVSVRSTQIIRLFVFQTLSGLADQAARLGSSATMESASAV